MSISKNGYVMKPFALLLLCAAFFVRAAGPDVIARSDRGLWPETLTSLSAFNKASRAEILAFSSALAEITALDESALKARLNLKSINLASVKKISDRLGDVLLENFKNASMNCRSGELFCAAYTSRDALFQASLRLPSFLPENLQPWFNNASVFHRQYAAELIRLAALLPKVSSEIDTFSEDEQSGFELADRHFLLTFDDGPSHSGGNTDKLLISLQKLSMQGIFYVLGERLQARKQKEGTVSLQSLYKGQCVALHGWQHKSHEKWEEWQKSVLDTQRLVKETLPEMYAPYFRPPYGQRRGDSGAFFSENHLSVALWNIDSQDWNPKISGLEAGNRVLTLMLLWRRGVILFHDIHPKAQEALIWLIPQIPTADIIWDVCPDHRNRNRVRLSQFDIEGF